MSRERIKEVLLSHGFTIKEGHTDLKEYVYLAAEALIEMFSNGKVNPTTSLHFSLSPIQHKKLFCDLTTAKEKAEFFRSGRAYETGIIAKGIEQEVAKAFDALYEVESGRK